MLVIEGKGHRTTNIRTMYVQAEPQLGMEWVYSFSVASLAFSEGADGLCEPAAVILSGVQLVPEFFPPPFAFEANWIAALRRR